MHENVPVSYPEWAGFQRTNPSSLICHAQRHPRYTIPRGRGVFFGRSVLKNLFVPDHRPEPLVAIAPASAANFPVPDRLTKAQKRIFRHIICVSSSCATVQQALAINCPERVARLGCCDQSRGRAQPTDHAAQRHQLLNLFGPTEFRNQ